MLARMTKSLNPEQVPVETPPEIRFRMRVRKGESIAIGPGKVALLEAIVEHGSISAAARSLNMSYRRAWLLIDELNNALTSPATTSEHGGKQGGGSVLTPVGAEVIRLYRDIEAHAYQAGKKQISSLTALLKA